MSIIESSIGITKQAESCPRAVPTFISVGELGRNSMLLIKPQESSSRLFAPAAWSKFFLTRAMAWATLMLKQKVQSKEEVGEVGLIV